MFKKNLYIYSAIATSMAILAELSHNLLFHGEFIDNYWLIVALLQFSLPMIFGSITLFGTIRAVHNKSIFRVFAILSLIFAILFMLTIVIQFLPKYRKWSFTNSKFFENSFMLLFGYYIIVGIISFSILLKRKWLPGVCLLMVVLPWVLMFATPDSFCPDWLVFFFGIRGSPAWIIIAWWLFMENATVSLPEAVDID